MKKIFKFLVVIPALLCSALFFVLGSSKTVKAVASVPGDIESFNSAYYNNAIIGDYYLDVFNSLDVDLTIDVPSGYNLYDAYTYTITRKNILFGNYTLLNGSVPGSLYSPRLMNIVCKVQQVLNTNFYRYVYDGSTAGTSTLLQPGSYYLQCHNSTTTSLSFTNDTNYSYYSNNVASSGEFNYSFIFSYRSGDTRSLNSFIGTSTSYNNNKVVGVLSSFNSTFTNYLGYTPADNVFLSSSVTGLTGSQTTTKVSVDSTGYSCNPTYHGTGRYVIAGAVTVGGVPKSFSFVSSNALASNSNNECVTNTADSYHTTLNFTFAEIKEYLGQDNYLKFLNNLTQDVDFIDTMFFIGGYYIDSSFILNFADGYRYNSMLPVTLKFKFNFNNNFSWLFNGLIVKSKVYAPQSSYNIPSITWYEFNDVAEISWVSLNSNTNSLSNWVLLFDSYRSPQSSYIEFVYSLSGTGTISSGGPDSIYDLNFNFLYMNKQDFNNFDSFYGVSYRKCKVYDILCWLQNGFTYIIYEMPVISPIINFVKSGITTITNFNSFMGNFTVWTGFIALVSVPVTWLIIKKFMGGDK